MLPCDKPFIFKRIMKKYYAVRSGRQCGLFNDWSSCEKQVKGYKGAEYKSFKTKEEAEAYLATETFSTEKDNIIQRYPCAYIDGSYDATTRRFSYGAIIMKDEETIKCFSDKFESPSLVALRNVAGEIKASEFAISYALKENWPHIDIYYDYFGIEKWALGEWKRNLEATQSYHAFCQNALKFIDIRFIKVKGHSGDKFNDMADRLAREALGL